MDYLIKGADYLARFPNFKLVGRREVLSGLYSILVRSEANSVILTGARGVGCDRLCLGIQSTKHEIESSPFDISGKRFFWLDVNNLFSSGNTSEINEAFQKIMSRIYHCKNSVLVIEDTRDFIDSARNAGCGHFVNSLIAAVRSREPGTQAILIVDDEDLEYVLKTHNDLRELFTIKYVDEPTGDTLYEIVKSLTSKLEDHHGIKVDEESIKTAIEFTNKYQTRDASLSKAQPERSVTLIDRALSFYKLASHTTAPEGFSNESWIDYKLKLKNCSSDQRDGEDAISQLEEEIEEEKNKNTSLDVGETASITDKRRKISAYQKEVENNIKEYERITKEINDKLKLTKDIVINEFARISGISASKLNQNEVEKLKTLEENLNKRIFGQDSVLTKVSNSIKIARVGGRNKNKPIASYFFLGPSGVGKTEVAKVLAYNMLGDDSSLSRFDMSEYQEKHAVARMIGAPPGYEGFEAGGQLTNLVRKNGNRIILFDEVEKGHPDVYDVLLQVVDAGRLTDNVGRVANFNESMIIMTSNIGAHYYLDESLTPEEAHALAVEELSTKFRPEFLNRFAGRKNILGFNRLALDSIKRIMKREIESLNSTYKEKGTTVSITDVELNNLCAGIYSPAEGARGIPGYIETEIEPIIVNGILDNPDQKGNFSISYELDTKKLNVTLEN